MTYSLKALFYTLQGEGARAGRAAVFCRFSGCNLWTGRERDRGDAICRFCDTDFVGTDGPGGGKFADAAGLARAARACWDAHARRTAAAVRPYAVCTGGEPLLQLDPPLVDALRGEGFEVAVETNGVLPPPRGLDWICVSPKAGSKLTLIAGHELKVVWPQAGTDLDALETLAFDHFFLQPMDGPDAAGALRACIALCLRRPQWRLSLQTHKLTGLP